MPTKRVLLSGAAVAGSLALVPFCASPALAAPGGAAFHTAAASNGTSHSEAGWFFTPKKVTSVSTTFTMPTWMCTSAASGFSPGAYLVTGKTSAVGAAVVAYCSGGKASAFPQVFAGQNSASGTNVIHPGDEVRVTASASSAGQTTTIKDLTKGHRFTLTYAAAGATATRAAIGVGKVIFTTSSGSPQVAPISNFKSMKFGAGKVNGKTLGAVSPRKAYNMVSSTGTLQIKTSALSSTGKSFTTTWEHS